MQQGEEEIILRVASRHKLSVGLANWCFFLFRTFLSPLLFKVPGVKRPRPLTDDF